MRRTIKLNEKWRFTDLLGITSEIDLPHTWNAIDGQDGGDDYKRGECRYDKSFARPAHEPETECVYLVFHGVNASARVILNGQALCTHWPFSRSQSCPSRQRI